MPRWRIAVLVALVAPLALFGVTAAAWAVDTRGDTGVRRGVELAGVDVGGLERAALEERVQALADDVAELGVAFNGGDLRLETTAEKIGLAVDVEASADAVMAAGRRDPGPLGPLRWAGAALGGRSVPLTLRIDRAVAVAELERLEGERRRTPTEPSLVVAEGAVVLVAGRPGGGLDIDAAVGALPRRLDATGQPVIVPIERVEIPTRLSDESVRALADRANEVTDGAIELAIGDTVTSIDGARLRPGFSVTTDGDGPTLRLDPTLVAAVLAQAAPPGYNPTGVTFALTDGRMTPVPGRDAVVCCAEDAPQRIVDALLAGRSRIELPTTTISAADGAALASALGVKEVVGEFTTRHPAGQPRVRNIHRIADMVRGVLIPPGETFSINDHVGRRTAEKGFVSAPVIDEGEFKEDIGGGVSQFATTLFNAAFFAGLDIPEHKAHSIYISRYPFGREATLAYPSIDLKIRNNSPYGVVIWPTYTRGSITVQLWSTRHAIGAQTGQNKTSGCGNVTVTRTRLFVDGHTDQQTYRASYDCDPPDH